MEDLIGRIDSISLELRKKYLPNLDNATVIAKLEQDEQLRNHIINTYIVDMVKTDEDFLIMLNNSLIPRDGNDKVDEVIEEDEEDEESDDARDSETDIDDKISDKGDDEGVEDTLSDYDRGDRMHIRYLYRNQHLCDQFSVDDKRLLKGFLNDLKHFKSDSEEDEEKDEDEDEDREEYLRDITTQNLDILRDHLGAEGRHEDILKSTPYQDLATRYNALYLNIEPLETSSDPMDIEESDSSSAETNKRRVSDGGESASKRPRLATYDHTITVDTKEKLHIDVDTALSEFEDTVDSVSKKLIATGDVIHILLDHNILVRDNVDVQEFEAFLTRFGFTVFLEEEGEYIVCDDECYFDTRYMTMIALEPEVNEMYDHFYNLAANLVYGVASSEHGVASSEPSSTTNMELADDLSLFEIRFEQHERTDTVIDPTTFKHVCDEIIQSFSCDAGFTPGALDAIQTAAEDYLIKIFDRSNRIAINAKRTIVGPDDIVTSLTYP
jgi:histone H3/H4